MSIPSELARPEAEAQVQSAAPLETAVRYLRKGIRLPRHIILAVLDEGHDLGALIRSIRPATLSV